MTIRVNEYRHEIDSWQHYWLRENGGAWCEVTYKEYSAGAKKAGFPAIAGFGANGVQGRITSDDQNIEKLYANEPDFVKIALSPKLEARFDHNVY